MSKLDIILERFNLNHPTVNVKPFGTGLINHTWLITTPTEKFILQKINDKIFKRPADIADNTNAIAHYLKQNHPEYFFVAPLADVSGKHTAALDGEGYFRIFPFVKNSVTFDVVETPSQAHEAARQFGMFTKVLRHFDATSLKTTLPDFHNLTLRHQQFKHALTHGITSRINEASSLISELLEQSDIVSAFEAIIKDPSFQKRVTHHDTKISNVLFRPDNTGICVIDLDTVMPGYFISDLGDMMRTYLSPVNEEEKDFNKIVVREEFLQAVVTGYYGEMRETLSDVEKDHFFFAGEFMIYMQALRFLSDYLMGDVYYPITYRHQNLIRAGNQVTLLKKLQEKEKFVQGLVASL